MKIFKKKLGRLRKIGCSDNKKCVHCGCLCCGSLFFGCLCPCYGCLCFSFLCCGADTDLNSEIRVSIVLYYIVACQCQTSWGGVICDFGVLDMNKVFEGGSSGPALYRRDWDGVFIEIIIIIVMVAFVGKGSREGLHISMLQT